MLNYLTTLFCGATLPVVPIVNSTIQQVEALAQNKNITIEAQLVSNEVEVFADSTALKRILENILTNAIKFSDVGKSIQIDIRDEFDCVNIVITDQGLGFSEQDKAEAFKKFSKLSAQPTADEPSTGLGLYIVKKLTEAMKGTIQLESLGKNKGCTFTLTLVRG